jgi:hypothetical protein
MLNNLQAVVIPTFPKLSRLQYVNVNQLYVPKPSLTEQLQIIHGKYCHAWALYYIKHTDDIYAQSSYFRAQAENRGANPEWIAYCWLQDILIQSWSILS